MPITGAEAERKARFFQMVNGEGGLTSDKDRIDVKANMPTLVVGLGGTGVDALLRMKYEVSRRFNLQANSDKPANIEYLAIDTDQEKAGTECNGTTLNIESEICEICVPGLPMLISNRSMITESYLRDWISPNITATGGTGGANGKRQVGRFMIMKNADLVRGRIAAKINNIYGNINHAIPMNVFVLAGISGGTGAGTFLDVAYMIKQILRDVAPNTVPRINAYLFLPDVNLSKRGLPAATRTYIPNNGFASLKELDYWMNAGDREEEFIQQYTQNFRVDTTPMSNKAPFTMCHLISAQNALGIAGDDAYDYAMRVAAESMINFIAQENAIGDKDSYTSFLDNIHTNLGTQVKHCCANHVYTVIGADARVLQKDDAINYIAALLLQKVDGLYGNVPGQVDIENAMRDSNVTYDYLYSRLALGLGRSVEEIKRNYPRDRVMAPGGPDLYDVLRGSRDAQRSGVFPQLSNEIVSEATKELCSRVEAAFKDAQSKGPYYAHKMICGYDDDQHIRINGISDLLNSIRANAIRQKGEVERTLPALNGKRRETYEAAVKHRNNFIFADSSYNSYLAALKNEHDAECAKLCCGQMIDVLDRIMAALTDYNNNIVEFFVNMLKALRETFRNNVGVMTNVAENGEGGGVVYTWKVDDFNLIKPILDEALRKDLDFDNNAQLIDDFLSELFDRRDEFAEEARMDRLGDVMSKYIERSFEQQIARSLEQRLAEVGDIAYSPDPTTGICQPLIDYVRGTVIPSMIQKAQPMIALDGVAFPLDNAVQYIFASVPASAINIIQGIQEYLAAIPISIQIQRATNSSRLFWLNSFNGIPLFAYSQIFDYERGYEAADKSGMGMHLRMSRDDDWTDLPSPLHETMWNLKPDYRNKAQKDRNDAARAVFDEAYGDGQHGMLRWSNGYLFMREVQENAVNNGYATTALWDIPVDMDLNRREAGIVRLMYLDFGTIPQAEIANMSEEERRNYKKNQFRECFTRSPGIQKKVEKQLKLYSRVKKLSSIPDFADVMITNGISVASGGLKYVIPGDEVNASKELLNLNARRDVFYPLYEVFRQYTDLEPQWIRVIEQRQSDTTDAMNNDDDSVSSAMRQQCAERLKALIAEVEPIVNAMNRDANFDAARLGDTRKFYVALLAHLRQVARTVLYRDFM